MLKTSSVGRFAVKGIPARLAVRPLTHIWPSGRPNVKLVPGPWYFRALYLRVFKASARRSRLDRCFSHAAIGSGASSRHKRPISSHSRAVAASPDSIGKTRAAQAGLDAATTAQFV